MLREKEMEIKLRVYLICTMSKYDVRDGILYNVRGPSDLVQVFKIEDVEGKVQEQLQKYLQE